MKRIPVHDTPQELGNTPTAQVLVVAALLEASRPVGLLILEGLRNKIGPIAKSACKMSRAVQITRPLG